MYRSAIGRERGRMWGLLSLAQPGQCSSFGDSVRLSLDRGHEIGSSTWSAGQGGVHFKCTKVA